MKTRDTNTTSCKITPFAWPILSLALLCFSASAFATPLPRPDHVVLVMEENHAYSEIIGSSSAPYINSLANAGALFTQSFAIEHPSQPNYLDIFSGSNQGITDDSCPHTFSTANLGAQLIAAGFTFNGYAEGLPSAGSLTCTSGEYARKHCPWIDWVGAASNAIPATSDQPFAAFPTDFTTLPRVSIVAPNLLDDMHDGTVSAGDTWLKNNLDAYAQWAVTHNSLLIVTWDEDDGSAGNHIATLFYGGVVKPGQYTGSINHYNILRTLEDMYGLPHAGNAASATAITNCWDLKFQAENLAVSSQTSGVTYRIVSDVRFSGGRASFFDSTAVNQFVSFAVPNIAAGTYDVRIGTKKWNNKGTFQLNIAPLSNPNGGSNLGSPVDEYTASETFTSVDLGHWTPGTTSDKAFKFTVTGKNAASTGFGLDIDYIELIPQ